MTLLKHINIRRGHESGFRIPGLDRARALGRAFAFGTIALAHGERVSALWIVIAAVCVYLIAYHFYSRFIAGKVLQLDGLRMTLAVRYNDGLDYVPANKYVLFGHHCRDSTR